ncbi:MAG: SDR family oxidoreductase [Burkholderiales bacterium]|nr:SDR family oxidoreductase [Burkholderiales bacterium]
MSGDIFRADALTGRVALVTGASTGLGRHFAGVLAAHGATVVLAARRERDLATAVADIVAAGGRAHAVVLDVRDPASVEAGVQAAAAAAGRLDILVNNAGVTVTRPALAMTEDEWRRVVDTNLDGAFRVARAVARTMVDARTGGVIVNIASVLGLRVGKLVAGYIAAKAGFLRLSEALALEWAMHGIRVNAIAPGYIVTDLNRGFLASPAGEAMVKRIPQRRFGEPADLDGALLLLASDAGRYITGSTITVDGGHTLAWL